MAVSIGQLEEFHEFASSMIAGSESAYDLEELCILWQLKKQPDEMAQSMAALQEGLNDIREGRLFDADDVITEIRGKFQKGNEGLAITLS